MPGRSSMSPLPETRRLPGVDKAIRGVRPTERERIDVKFVDPVGGFSKKKSAPRVAVRPVELNRRSPGRFVAVSKVRPIVPQVIAFGSQVVVYHVENNRESSL